MKLSDLEDADQIVTKEWLRAELTAERDNLKNELLALELRIADRIRDSERATRAAIYGVYTMVVGTYALIVMALFVNHFWK